MPTHSFRSQMSEYITLKRIISIEKTRKWSISFGVYLLSESTAVWIQLQNKLTDEEKVSWLLTLVIAQSSGILVVSNFINEADVPVFAFFFFFFF